MDSMNCVQIRRTHAKRRMVKMTKPIWCPKGSSLGSANEPAMKKKVR